MLGLVVLFGGACFGSEGTPCGGKDTCPSGFSCQDHGGGYRCHELDDDAVLDGGENGPADSGSPPTPPPGTGGQSGTANDAGDDLGVSSADASLPSADASPPSADGSTQATPPEAGDEPWVTFVIDGSSSMCDVFGSLTRWTALRAALLDPVDGVLYRYQQRAAFGIVLFDGSIDLNLLTVSTGGSPSPACAGGGQLPSSTGECLNLIEVPAARDNAAAIDGSFPALELGGSTPTDRALDSLLDRVTAPNVGATPAARRIVLVTDGQPNDICIGGAGGDGTAQRAVVIAAVDRAAAAGITTNVIGMGAGDPTLSAHLAQIAQHGAPSDPAAAAFEPGNPAELRSALEQIIGAALAPKP